MSLKLKCFSVLSAVFLSGFQVYSQQVTPSPKRDMIVKANDLVREYNKGATRTSRVIKVVYFHGNDLEPLSGWKERLTRTLDDVSAFYREEFKRHGIEIEGVPFEKKDGEYVFHVVKGDLPTINYGIKSGSNILREIYIKTKPDITFSNDYTLVINGLCYKRNDGTYVFHSPYYGTGSPVGGVCQVADCELLDSKYLTNTLQRMAFSEMTINYKECLVAEFNSWYIGGIAHEMGHIFGLPHDFGNPTELNISSISLMGQYGSRHFRDYLWNGEQSAVFSSAAILQLISHPLFAQSARISNTKPKSSLSAIIFGKKNDRIIMKASIKSEELPYGVVSLMRPANLSEYFNRSFSDLITGKDSLSVDLGKWPEGNYNLQLLLIYLNGSTIKLNRLVAIDNKGNAEIVNNELPPAP
jgi:hypothetical protein